MSADTLAELVAKRRILVVVGSGGVGKTTLAAALALEVARSGRRALVLTIDPARRLADALGVESLGNEPTPIPRDTLEALRVPPEGGLDALMLDMKRTFDDLVRRFSDSEATRARIFDNPIYQHVSDALAGSSEYAAMERVYDLAEDGDYDLLVLDTPPSGHALDFLDAPQRLIEFLDSRLVQMLLHPAFAAGRFGFRIFQRGTHRVFRIIERISGVSFLEDISDFLLAFEGMSQGFRERARRVRGLLLGTGSGFVLAVGPTREAVAQSERLIERLQALGAPLVGVVANRVREWPGGGEPPKALPWDPAGPDGGAGVEALARALAGTDGEGFPAQEAAREALRAAAEYAAIVRRDAETTDRLFARVRGFDPFLRRVPELPRDVRDLEGLARIADALFGGAEEPSTSGAKERDGTEEPAGEPGGGARGDG